MWGTDEAWADGIQGQEVTSDARQAAVLAAGTEIEREFRGEEGENIMVRQFCCSDKLISFVDQCHSAKGCSGY